LRIVSEATSHEPEPKFRAFHLEVVGNDREGIVRDVSRALAARGVNVEELDTSCESAPMTGGMLFHADAVLRVPEGQDIEQLRKALEALADDLMVDVQLLPKDQRPNR
jgi:glycine cleavage system regulatory protein